MNAHIKNLIIDLGGVLIDLDRNCFVEAFSKLGATNIEELIDSYLHQELFLSWETGELMLPEFRDQLRQLVGCSHTDEQIDDAWNSFLLGIPTYKLDLLDSLRSRYNLYLLSNTNLLHWQFTQRSTLAYKGRSIEEYFDRAYLSYEMKQVKPSLDIFRTVLADNDLIPEQTLFIDDSEVNCLAAQSLGINTYMPGAKEDWSHLFKQ